MSNAAMDTALGWNRFEVEGRFWIDASVPADSKPNARSWLSAALRGAVDQGECEVFTTDGRRLRFVMNVSLVGRGREQGLLLLVMSSTLVQPAPAVGPEQDHDYEINWTPAHFGRVLRVLPLGGIVNTSEQGQCCFERFHGLTSPCLDCPVLRAARDPWPRIIVRRPRQKPGIFQVVTANHIDTVSVRLSVREMSPTILDAINGAKIAELAATARLSPREHSVLGHLLMGRTLQEIAEALEISPRTVKFHQARLLVKVGADSRHDLMRLVSSALPLPPSP